MTYPQVGDIWKFDDDKMHFLILDEQFDEEDGTLYDVLILENGKMDTINRGSVSGWGMVKVA